MTRMLLDTDAFFGLRRVKDARPLPDRLVADLEAADAVMMSAVSLFEFNQKIRVGKLDASPIGDDEIALLQESGIILLPLTPSITAHAASLQWTHKGHDHRDPFDRMIAATALAENFIVVSSDSAFDALDIERAAF